MCLLRALALCSGRAHGGCREGGNSGGLASAGQERAARRKQRRGRRGHRRNRARLWAQTSATQDAAPTRFRGSATTTTTQRNDRVQQTTEARTDTQRAIPKQLQMLDRLPHPPPSRAFRLRLPATIHRTAILRAARCSARPSLCSPAWGKHACRSQRARDSVGMQIAAICEGRQQSAEGKQAGRQERQRSGWGSSSCVSSSRGTFYFSPRFLTHWSMAVAEEWSAACGCCCDCGCCCCVVLNENADEAALLNSAMGSWN